MYVTTSAAALHLEMVEAFGLPTPTNPKVAEIFGDYHVGSSPRFWKFDPQKQLWDVKSERTLYSTVAPCADWTDDERDEIAHAMVALNMMEAPPFPEKTEQKIWEPPFIHESCIFAWVYLPELKRWSLAPLGKFNGKGDVPIPN